MRKKSIVQSLLAICLMLVMVLSLTGCGSTKTSSAPQSSVKETSASQQEGPRFDPKWQLGQPKPVAGAKPKGEIKWVKWDPSTAKWVSVEGSGDPSSWVPKVRPAGKKWRVGVIAGALTIDYVVKAFKNLEKGLGDAGIEFVSLDNNYPDNLKPLSNADILVAQKVDLVLSQCIEGSLNTVVVKKFSDAKIPVIAIEAAADSGALFFGADNYGAGILAGKAAVEYSKSHNWDPKETAVVLLVFPGVGEVPLQRPMGFRDTILNDMKDMPLKNVFEIPADLSVEKAMESMSAWVTAHPTFKHILSVGLDDGECTGAATALNNAGLGDSSAVYGMTGNAVGVATLRKPTQNNAFKGSVLYTDKYSDYLVPMTLDILEGKPVPDEVHYKLVLLDHNNVDQYFPK